ncbi:MAG TPA: phosphatase PAP2 family protein [Thermoanaerobaculia bacterium]
MSATPRAPFLFALGVGAAGAFALMARAVARRKTAPIDHEIHGRVAVETGHPIREAAEVASPIGKWWTYVPAAAVTAACVGGCSTRASRVHGAAAIVAAAAAAALINKRLDELPQPPAPPGRPSPTHPVFPSGHAFGTAAVALTAAYILSREELVAATIGFPLAMTVPTLASLARMAEEKHWFSDIIGGHLAALTLAAMATAAYEMGRARGTGE